MVALSAVVVALVALLLVGEGRDDPRLRWFAKPLASAAFVALGASTGVMATPWGLPMLAGFVLCWFGDVFLIPADKRVFLAGIGAFLLGHVGFAVAFLLRGLDPLATGLTAVLLLPAAWGVWRWLEPHLSGVMRRAVPAYIVVICTMVATAVGTSVVAAPGRGPVLALGAMLFWVSDLCVARQRFVAPGFVNRAVGLPLYYGAMLTLAWGLPGVDG